MERIRTKKLPPIFKMSVLWNILPYYGHIHRWRRLLEKINTKTKEIWDQNREQLMYIGRDFKREIELDNLKKWESKLRPNRNWLDLFSLSLSNYYFKIYNFDFTTLTNNLTEDEVIIIDSHDNLFKRYQINFWSKDRISDILPAINWPTFKFETEIFKTSEMTKIRELINNKIRTKSIVIENAGDKLSINFVYGDTIKITPMTFYHPFLRINFFDKLKERYKLWQIDDCACKPKKIRVWVYDLKDLKNAIDQLKWISNINDAKLGVYIFPIDYKCFTKYDIIFFNDSSRWMSDNYANLIFTGDTLAVVDKGNYYNFRLDQRTKESEDSFIIGNIIENNKNKNCFAFDESGIYNLRLILTDKEEIDSERKDFIKDLKIISTLHWRDNIVFNKKDITLKINIDKVKLKKPELEFYSKVDAKINDKIKSKKLIKMVKHIPSHLELRLEADNIEQIIEMMKSKTLIEKLKEKGTKFLHKGIEIEPRIIESKMDAKYLRNKVKEKEAKRDRLNMDCDE